MSSQPAFDTLLALETAVGVLLGLLVLSQQPSLVQLVGIVLVVMAGAAAQRGGRRTPLTNDLTADGDEPVLLPLLALEPK